jgi:hypothetical protein
VKGFDVCVRNVKRARHILGQLRPRQVLVVGEVRRACVRVCVSARHRCGLCCAGARKGRLWRGCGGVGLQEQGAAARSGACSVLSAEQHTVLNAAAQAAAPAHQHPLTCTDTHTSSSFTLSKRSVSCCTARSPSLRTCSTMGPTCRGKACTRVRPGGAAPPHERVSNKTLAGASRRTALCCLCPIRCCCCASHQ